MSCGIHLCRLSTYDEEDEEEDEEEVDDDDDDERPHATALTTSMLSATSIQLFPRICVLCRPFQFSSVLFCSVLFCSVLYYSVQFSSVQFSSVQFCSVLFSSVLSLFYIRKQAQTVIWIG
ncbi:hypothetical protein M0802_008465 [Mischocyttarus mexicanus]|nr:hypothetical protein M0802_008465 [Mischocyttarus mexicanus]